MATATYERYRNYQGHYHNSAKSHLLGKVGEIAVEAWLATEGIEADSAFRDDGRDREPDVQVRGLRLDVKTWSPEYWAAYGRCVTPGQLKTKFSSCDGVIWAVGSTEAHPMTVTIMGWSSVDDIRSAPIRMTGPAYRQIANHQLDQHDLRELSRLFDAP